MKRARMPNAVSTWLLMMAAVALALTLAACGGSPGSNSPNSPNNNVPPTGPNVQGISVSGGPNFPVVSLNVCIAGSTCVTVNNILVDTASYGLRVLGSTLSGLALPQTGAGPMSECVVFADGTIAYGLVLKAEVQMAGETTQTRSPGGIPIQVIGDSSISSSFPNVPVSCDATPTTDPFFANTALKFGDASQPLNGILGIGPFVPDCPGCDTNANADAPNVMYYTCSSSTSCSNNTRTVAVLYQIANPVFYFADNNGVIVVMESVSDGGQPSATGSLVFGIGTQSNNGLGSATVLTLNGYGNLTTTFSGRSYSSGFFDTGSNALYFSTATLSGLPSPPSCNGFYCPASTQTLQATNTGTSGQSIASFKVGNGTTLIGTGYQAFDDLAAPQDSHTFDWGLPFFFGRNVYIGIYGTSASGYAGPFVAY